MCRRMLAELQSKSTVRLYLTHLEAIWQGVEFKCFLLQLVSDIPFSAGPGLGQLNVQAMYIKEGICCCFSALPSAVVRARHRSGACSPPLGCTVPVTLGNEDDNKEAGRRAGRRKRHHNSAKPGLISRNKMYLDKIQRVS